MNWYKLAQGIIVTVDPSITSIPLVESPQGTVESGGPQDAAAIARRIIQKYYSRIDPRGHQFAGSRYVFHISKIDNNYRELTLTVQFQPNNKKSGEEVPNSPDQSMYEYINKYKGGKTGRTRYKSPKDAVTEIPEDPSMGYRGMAWEEWQSIQKTGFVGSKGHYNLGPEQENLTCFGYTPSTALHYASSFAPAQYTLSQKKPGVVIAVPRTLLLTHKEYPQGIPNGEMGFRGMLSMDKIAHAWMMVVTETKDDAYMEFRIPWVNKNKNRYDGYSALGVDQATAGSGSTQVVLDYAIRQLL